MLMLRVLTAKFDYAAAEVSDSQYVYRVEYNPYAENFFIVYDEGGAVLESYLRLEDCVYSRFSGIFLALQKAMNACNLVYGTNILSEITSSKEISAESNRITASNRFTYRGKQYVARAELDFSQEIPVQTAPGSTVKPIRRFIRLLTRPSIPSLPILITTL